MASDEVCGLYAIYRAYSTIQLGAEKQMDNQEIESRQRLDKPEGVPSVRRVVRFID